MADTPLLVMIDPGHGGHDPGAVFPRDSLGGIGQLREATLNEKLAPLLAEALAGHGHRAILSRDLTAYATPGERARRANRAAVDCFVSLHVNAFVEPQPSGIRFYVRQGQTRETHNRLSATLAAAIQTQAKLKLSQFMPTAKRIVQRDDLTVLTRTVMPAVLIETGFLTNPMDRRALANPVFWEQAATAYAKGIDLWAKQYRTVRPDMEVENARYGLPQTRR
jgi:N-acetylmuramoyl-L-alanine amidase